MNKIKLICFPYAGGSTLIFKAWKKYLHKCLELHPIELAGRGIRMGEELYQDWQEAIDDIYNLVKPEILQGKYAFFGHSMGCKIAYELTHLINERQLPAPAHIFFSGRGAPHLKNERENYHDINDVEFKRKVVELGGTPPEFFEHPELMNLFLPVIRNDFKLSEVEVYNGKIRTFTQDITVFLGEQDSLTTDQCLEWRLHTQANCNIHYFPGGHFFIHDYASEMIDKINQILIRYN